MNSDKSQPIKIVIGIAIFAAIVFFGTKLTGRPPLRGAGNDPAFANTTSTTQTCGGSAPVTLLSATNTARTAFDVSIINDGTSIFLCRDTTCATSKGRRVGSSTTFYSQQDSYIGPYSCVAAASTTVSLWLSPQ